MSSHDPFSETQTKASEPILPSVQETISPQDGLAHPEQRSAKDAERTIDHLPSQASGISQAIHPQPFREYEILQALGEGAMGIVYKARHIQLNRIVAIKMLRDRISDRPEYQERFLEEARAVAELHHPNIVQLYEIGEQNGLPYFSLEFVSGCTLSTWIQKRKLAAREAAQWIKTLADAMAAAHAQQLVHRDLKPDNILLHFKEDSPSSSSNDPDAWAQIPFSAIVPKIADFGIAKRMDVTSYTQTGVRIGTPAYMSPEQVAGKNRLVGPLTDVYALGVIFYQLLTGRLPFWGETIDSLYQQILFQEAPALRSMDAKIPKDLETICLKCLNKEISKRYASAHELAEDLERYLNNQPIKARPTSRAEQFQKWMVRNPGISALTALAVVLFMAGAIGIYIKYLDAKEQEQEAIRLSKIAKENENQTLVKAHEARIQTIKAKENEELANQKREAAAKALQLADERQKSLAAQIAYSQLLLAPTAFEKGDLKLAKQRLRNIPPEHRHWEWHFLRRAFDNSLFSLEGHKDTVTKAAYSPDGRRIATASLDQFVRLWDAPTGRLISQWRAHTAGVTDLAWSPDSTRLVTGSQDNKIKIWDTRSGQELFQNRKRISIGQTQKVRWSPDGSKIASYHKTFLENQEIHIWDAKDGKWIATLAENSANIMELCWSPDGQRLLIVESDQLELWNAVTGQIQVTKRETIGYSLQHVSWSPDGKLIAGGAYSSVALCNPDTWEITKSSKTIGPNLRAIAWNPDGTSLAIGQESGNLFHWEIQATDTPKRFLGHTNAITSLSWSPDGIHLVSASADRTAKIWDMRTSQPTVDIKPRPDDQSRLFDPLLEQITYRGSLNCFQFHPNQSLLAVGHYHFLSLLRFQILDTQTREILLAEKQQEGPEEPRSFKGDIHAIVTSPTGNQLATISAKSYIFWLANNQAKIWDWHSRTLLWDMSQDFPNLQSLDWSPDGQQIVVASGTPFQNDGELAIWNVAERKLHFKFSGISRTPNLVRWSPKGNRILTVSNTKDWQLWEPTGKRLPLRQTAAEGITRLSWCPDGRFFATIHRNHQAMIWNAETGKSICELLGHMDEISGIAWSPDQQRIATCSHDMTVKIWDPTNGQMLVEIQGEQRPFIGVTWSRDGSQLITGNSAKIQYWESRSEEDFTESERLVRYLRLTHVAPTDHMEQYRIAKEAKDLFAQQYYLNIVEGQDRWEGNRPYYTAKWDQFGDPLKTRRRWEYHTPTGKKRYSGLFLALTMQRHPLATRLLGQHLLRLQKPTEAIPVLHNALSLRTGEWPPVEELLLALAYQQAGQQPEADKWYQRATQWLDRYQQPLQLTNLFGHAASGLMPALGVIHQESEDPRYNPFNWESWHECHVFRKQYESKQKAQK